MDLTKWNTLKKCVALEPVDQVPVSLIVDSPWIPGYLGISTLDYLTLPEIWLEANLRVEEEFPEVIFLPGFWLEMGMAAEPSGFGGKTSFYHHKTPLIHPCCESAADLLGVEVPDPRTDGLMPIILNVYQYLEPQIKDAGHHIKVVAARGPLAIATHLMGVTNFLLGLKLEPAQTAKLLAMTTELVKNWLQAQAEALSEVEGVMVLDDIVGFLSPKDYQQFAHPYLKQIYDAFPGAVKIFHNDMNNPSSYPYLEELGVNIFNFTHLIDMASVRQAVGDRVCLMGNVAPLDVLAQGTPREVAEQAANCLKTHPGKSGMLLSAGGGVSPDTPGENIRALIAAANV
jgi:uroporphyrinogen-III decarboxylase